MLETELREARETIRALRSGSAAGLTSSVSASGVAAGSRATQPAQGGPPTEPATPDDITERLRAAIARTTALESVPSDETPLRAVRVLPPGRGDVAIEPVDLPGYGQALRPPVGTTLGARLLGVGNLLLRLLLLGSVIGLLALLAPLAVGYKVLPVLGGSMEPAIKLGSVIVAKPVAPADVQMGDVITFSDRNRAGVLVTHRVVSLETGERGRPVIRTRGDANNVEDAWDVPTDQPIEKTVFWLPYAGYLVAYLASPQAKFALAGLIALLVVYQVLASGRSSRGTAH